MTTPAELKDRYISVDEVAAYLNINKGTVYRWIKTRQLPAHRVGRLWRFRLDEINNWARN
jgi:excisionase family DNA binding protein